jgi:hypothetical protein
MAMKSDRSSVICSKVARDPSRGNAGGDGARTRLNSVDRRKNSARYRHCQRERDMICQRVARFSNWEQINTYIGTDICPACHAQQYERPEGGDVETNRVLKTPDHVVTKGDTTLTPKHQIGAEPILSRELHNFQDLGKVNAASSYIPVIGFLLDLVLEHLKGFSHRHETLLRLWRLADFVGMIYTNEASPLTFEDSLIDVTDRKP